MAIDDDTSYELTGYQVKDLAQKIRAKADSNSLASVATSGLYSDLIGAPTIPTVYNGTLTIQQNGTTLGTFSANQDTNETINITGGGGSSTTTYYIAQGAFDTASSTKYSIYSDNQLTQAVDMTTFTNAYLSGPVLIIEVGNAGFAQVFSVVGWVENAGDDPSQPFEPFFTAVTYEKSVDIEWYSTTQVEVEAVSNLMNFTGATASVAGKNGLVPAPTTSDPDKFLKGDGTWATVPSGGPTTNLYWDVATSNFYKDNAMGQLMAPSAIFDAFEAGHTTFEDGTDTYIIVHVFPSAKTITAVSSVYAGTSSYGYLLTFTYDDNSSEWVLHNNDIINKQMTGATSGAAGAAGIVPAPAAGDEGKALHGDGTWKDTTAKLVEMSYGEANAWTKFITAYNAGSIVYCRASSNANPGTGSQTRKAFMAYVNNETNPTSVEFQYVRSVSSKTDSQPVDQVFVYTLTNTNGGTWSVASRNMAPKIAAGTGINVSYSNGTYTISLA